MNEDTMADLDSNRLRDIHRYWCAANYLTIGQIYLRDNPLLREPLRREHIKPRLLGHWGTSPGLSFIYAHLNRLIKETDARIIYLTGPGHGGPAIVANVYLEGTYTEIYPQVTRDTAGLQRLFRQFSTPGGIPSHVSVPTPGSIHEGGELGYVLAHAFGAVFDNPDLIAIAVVGDGEAETGPLEGSWKSVKFLNPARDGAVLPILHLNGYKISGPTVMGRDDDSDIQKLLEAHGYEVHFVAGPTPDPHAPKKGPGGEAGDDRGEASGGRGDEAMPVHAEFARVLDLCYAKIRAIQADARGGRGFAHRAAWPVIVLRTPKGWTGPRIVDGLLVEGTFRAHQVPLANVRDDPEHLRMLEGWMRSYRPDALFDPGGRLAPELSRLAPTGDRRMGSSPHANGGKLTVDLTLPDLRQYAVAVLEPGTESQESTRRLGQLCRDLFQQGSKPGNFRLFCPDETNSNRLGDVFSVENRCSVGAIVPGDDHVAPDGRVMEVLSEHLCQGWLEGYLLTGRHGLFATYEAFAMVSASMTIQHTKWLEESIKLAWRAPIPSLNILLTSTCWRNDHNGFSHQGPGLIDTVLAMKGTVARIYLPPDANCLLSVVDHCLRSRDYVNLIVIDKQPQLQWLSWDAAWKHGAAGAATWPWASNDGARPGASAGRDIGDGAGAGGGAGDSPDVVLAAAGDTPTLEIVAAAWLLRRHVPDVRVRVVNVVDLMCLSRRDLHPHGFDEGKFIEIFTADRPVVFAFHGYPRAIHALLHGRPQASRFHVRGFMEEGTTTTPFDMVVKNQMSRFHLCIEALRRIEHPRLGAIAGWCERMLEKHAAHIHEHGEDLPEIRDWVWTAP